MRIATWNINGMRARLDFVTRWLADRKPDVVGLQELKTTDEQFPHDAIEAAGYRALTHGQKAWNGVAILARQGSVADSLTLEQEGLPGQEDFGARLLTAKVEQLRFTTVYCPNGKTLDHDDFGRKLAWFDDLSAHFDAVHDVGQSHVLCGDFNICPTDLDSWHGEGHRGQIFHTDVERERTARLEAWGFVDLFRVAHPDTQAFSWWDYRGGAFHRKHGLRIDFLLATPDVSDRLESVEIDREYRKKLDGLTPSDHAPVFADLTTP